MLVTSQPKQPVSPQPHSIGPLPNLQIIPGPVLPPDISTPAIMPPPTPGPSQPLPNLLVHLNFYQICSIHNLDLLIALSVKELLDTSPELSPGNVRK